MPPAPVAAPQAISAPPPQSPQAAAAPIAAPLPQKPPTPPVETAPAKTPAAAAEKTVEEAPKAAPEKAPEEAPEEAAEAAIETAPDKSPPPVEKPKVDSVEPAEAKAVPPSPQVKALEDVIKDQVLDTKLPKSDAILMAKPDIPSVIPLRPYGTVPTSQGFHLPEKPPEGVSPSAKKIQERLKKRPPAHDPDEVLPEDLSVKGAKEM